MNITRILLIAVLMVLVLSGCGRENKSTPTLQPTDTPGQTDSPAPTNTPVPTNTPTEKPSPPITLEDAIEVRTGAFSFQPVPLMHIEYQGEGVFLNDLEGNLLISMVGASIPFGEEETLEDNFENYVRNMEYDIENFGASDPYSYTVSDIEGVAADVSGFLFDEDFIGKIVVVVFSDSRVFFAMGFMLDSDGDNQWETEGKYIFEAIMGSVKYLEELEGSVGCEISDDPSYGYTQENAIKVGGDFMTGPSRERAFLDSLLGPNGETISYERLGSVPFEDVILDIYEVTYAGLSEPITLYIDEYTFEDLIAPVGFTCTGAFPLGEP